MLGLKLNHVSKRDPWSYTPVGELVEETFIPLLISVYIFLEDPPHHLINVYIF